jgi:uncharacterized protein
MKLPAKKCEGCGECCGVIPVTSAEFEKVKQYAFLNGVTPLDQGLTCPFRQNNRCQVYPVRPIICRIFGHSVKLVCPKGHNVLVSERTLSRAVTRNGEPSHILHELAGVSEAGLIGRMEEKFGPSSISG